MGHNVGAIDKAVRLAALLAITTLYFMQLINGTLSMVVLGIAIYVFMTVLMAYCPVMEMMNLSTLEKKKFLQKKN